MLKIQHQQWTKRGVTVQEKRGLEKLDEQVEHMVNARVNRDYWADKGLTVKDEAHDIIERMRVMEGYTIISEAVLSRIT